MNNLISNMRRTMRRACSKFMHHLWSPTKITKAREGHIVGLVKKKPAEESERHASESTSESLRHIVFNYVVVCKNVTQEWKTVFEISIGGAITKVSYLKVSRIAKSRPEAAAMCRHSPHNNNYCSGMQDDIIPQELAIDRPGVRNIHAI